MILNSNQSQKFNDRPLRNSRSKRRCGISRAKLSNCRFCLFSPLINMLEKNIKIFILHVSHKIFCEIVAYELTNAAGLILFWPFSGCSFSVFGFDELRHKLQREELAIFEMTKLFFIFKRLRDRLHIFT